jgi:hypothetical protein
MIINFDFKLEVLNWYLKIRVYIKPQRLSLTSAVGSLNTAGDGLFIYILSRSCSDYSGDIRIAVSCLLFIGKLVVCRISRPLKDYERKAQLLITVTTAEKIKKE